MKKAKVLKMTDNDIIKALELCFTPKGTTFTCGECPYHKSGKLCKVERDKNALDLINRQKAEIERLNKEVDRLSQCVLYHDGQIADARAEAITEFAERVKEKHFEYFNFIFSYPAFCKLTDEIAKEMKGE